MTLLAARVGSAYSSPAPIPRRLAPTGRSARSTFAWHRPCSARRTVRCLFTDLFLGGKITLNRWLGSLCSALSGVVLFTNPGSAGVLDASWTSPTTNTDGSALTALASYRVYYVAADASPCPGITFWEVASATTTPDGRTVSVTLTGLTTDMYYTVAVTAVDLGGNESACSTTAGAVARQDNNPVGSSESAVVSSSDSGAVNPSDPVAGISGDGAAVNPTNTGDGGAVDGQADISPPATDTGDGFWRWRY
jgi:hypothetical protein